MPRRFQRLGAWLGSVAVLLASTIGPLVPSVHAQAPDPTETITTEPVLQDEYRASSVGPVLINELLPNPLTGNEFVELRNTSASDVSLSGWTLSDEASVRKTFTSEVIPAGGFLTHDFTSAVLNNDKDTLTLKDNTGATRDLIGYGPRVADMIVVSAQGKSIGRVPDGSSADFAGASDGPAPHWYSGLSPTRNVTNDSPVVPSRPTGASVTVGANNAAHVINLANRTATSVNVTLGSASLATDTVTAELFDSTSPTPTRKTGTVLGTSGAGTATVTGIDTTATPSQIDGAITVRSFVTATSGISTGYVTGTAATRDTVAPADPTAASILAGSGNATNVINTASGGAVSPSVTLPASTLATDTVRVDLTGGSTTVSASQTAPAGGGIVTLTTLTDELVIHAIDGRTLPDGSVAVKATLIDAAGNTSSTLTGSTAVKDTAAPAASVEMNSGASVSSSGTLSLTIAASDVGSGVTEMRLSNSADFAGASYEAFATNKTWTLTSGEGSRTVYVQVRDAAGNPSATASDTILVDADAVGITLVSLATGSQTVRHLPLEATVTATSPTTLTFASYLNNPGTALPIGSVGLPGFWEVGLADPTKITFPIQLRLYYTAADLLAAGITHESQLQGLAYFDQTSQIWKYFATTGASTADVVVDGTQYAGFLFATTDHLTPIVGLADTTPPPAPAALTATGGDQSVDLAWSAASETASYVIRYRADGDPAGAYFEVTLSSSTTSTRVTNLENGRRYEFGVASQDAAGNRSPFTTAFATVGPSVPAKPAVINVVIPSARAAGRDRAVTPRVEPPTPTATTTEAPTEAPLDDGRDLSRLLITLAILIIAIGAGTAGYYGYQWWASRSTQPPSPPSSKPPVTPPPGSPPVPPVPGPTTPPAPPSIPPPAPPSPQPPAGSADKPEPPQPPSGRW